MTLRTERLKDFQSVAEIETNTDTILHASIRVRMRVAGDGGAVAGVFLYSNDNNESDLEVLTRDPSEDFRATNQPALDLKGQVIEDATNTIPIPAADNDQNGKTVKALGSSVTTNTTAVVNGTRGDWNEYRLDWLPGSSEWIVNGHLVDSKTYGVPTGHCHLAINLWSNGGSWSGNMSVGGQAHMDIEWIEMAYNVTGEEGSHCDILCGVDETGSDIGSPKFISGAARSRPMAGSGILWSLAILVAGWSFA